MQPPRSKTIPDLLDEAASRHPGREFVVCGARRLTYARFREQARQLAKGLLRLGVQRGDKVALLMGNRAEWLLVDFAVTCLGATLVPVSTWSTARELEYVLRHADASTLITVDQFLRSDYMAMLWAICPELASARGGTLHSERLPELRRVVCLSDHAHCRGHEREARDDHCCCYTPHRLHAAVSIHVGKSPALGLSRLRTSLTVSRRHAGEQGLCPGAPLQDVAKRGL